MESAQTRAPPDAMPSSCASGVGAICAPVMPFSLAPEGHGLRLVLSARVHITGGRVAGTVQLDPVRAETEGIIRVRIKLRGVATAYGDLCSCRARALMCLQRVYESIASATGHLDDVVLSQHLPHARRPHSVDLRGRVSGGAPRPALLAGPAHRPADVVFRQIRRGFGRGQLSPRGRRGAPRGAVPRPPHRTGAGRALAGAGRARRQRRPPAAGSRGGVGVCRKDAADPQMGLGRA
jgi:hypothetical protein